MTRSARRLAFVRLAPAVGIVLVLAGCGGNEHRLVRVPPVDTTSLGVALDRLDRSGLRVALTDFGPLPAGYTLDGAAVGDQDPEPGTRVSRGSVVRLNMHGVTLVPSPAFPIRHPSTVVVPRFTGLAWPDAAKRNGPGFWLEIGHVPALGAGAADEVLDHYVVTRQSPQAGALIPWGGVRLGDGGFRVTVVRLELAVR